MKSFFILIFLMLMLTMGWSADYYNVGTVTVYETYTQIVYKWAFTFTDALYDSTDSIHSPALLIGDCNDADGYVYTKASAASNVDLLLHTSMDNSVWNLHTADNEQDDLSSTAVFDTIGIYNATNDIAFHSMKFLVLEMDGQTGTGNDSGQTWVVAVVFTKDLDAQNNGQPIKMSGYINSRGTP